MRLAGAILSLAIGSAGVVLPAQAEAKAHAIDCPLRDAPFSIDTPMVDLLTKREAVAVIERLRPDILRTLTRRMRETTAPTFGAIITPRAFAVLKREDLAKLKPVDAELRRITVTGADQDRRCARYDTVAPTIDLPPGRPRLLLFEKMTGFRDGPSVEAASAAIKSLAAENGWAVVQSDKGAVMAPEILSRFDAVIWNNVSGDVLTLRQRKAFRAYIEGGGGFVGLHGSGGDPAYFWQWYVDELIGARFRGHPLAPQFQRARIVVEDDGDQITSGLGKDWWMTDEWYSFATSPRQRGAHVLLALDERTYSTESFGQTLAMGDHPIAWTRCVGRGRSFYSAIGHLPESYSEPHHRRLLMSAIAWAANRRSNGCPGKGAR